MAPDTRAEVAYWQGEATKYIDYLAQVVDMLDTYPLKPVFTQYPAMSRPIQRAKALAYALEQLEQLLLNDERE